MDTINLFAASVTLVLGVTAIVLSIVFYRMSNVQAERAAESASQIRSSVDRLEKLFGSLYSDTFSMMRETVTDMRQHVWRSPVEENSLKDNDAVQKEVSKLKGELLASIGEVSHSLGVTDANVQELRRRLGPEVDEALKSARTINVSHETTVDILRFCITRLRATGSFPQISHILQKFGSLTTERRRATADALFDMRRMGLVMWPGAEDSLRAMDRIELTAEGLELAGLTPPPLGEG
jgi:hypothetical protein